MEEEEPERMSWRWCEVNAALAQHRMEEVGANTVCEDKGFRDTFMGVTMAFEMAGKEYFKEEIKAASDGHRGQPKPDPNSAESKAFCRTDECVGVEKTYYDKMDPAAEAEHLRHMDEECVEHPSRNGKTTHPNCCCCSVWHPDRHIPRMHLSWPEREQHWNDVQSSDETQRKDKHLRLVRLVQLRIQERKKLNA